EFNECDGGSLVGIPSARKQNMVMHAIPKNLTAFFMMRSYTKLGVVPNVSYTFSIPAFESDKTISLSFASIMVEPFGVRYFSSRFIMAMIAVLGKPMATIFLPTTKESGNIGISSISAFGCSERKAS